MSTILIFSAHPDDAETGTGGLCCRAARKGHQVTIVHVSKEVRGNKINNVPERLVRTAEAREAGRILGARIKFFDYLMGECPATVESTDEIAAFLRREKPDVVLTQWPVDTHPDHQVVGILPLRLYVWDKNFCLGFYEVFTGMQTLSFQPNRYLDISGVITQKRKAILAHRSQNPELQVSVHEKMSAFRGLEMGGVHTKCKHAEAFHILGGEAKTAFDSLFAETRVHKPSGGMKAFRFAKRRKES